MVVIVRVMAGLKLGMNKVKDEIVGIRSRMRMGVVVTVRVRVYGVRILMDKHTWTRAPPDFAP